MAGSPRRQTDPAGRGRPRAAVGLDPENQGRFVEDGWLVRATGSAEAPFDATYSLTEQGEHAAEYGECDFGSRARAAGAAEVSPKAAATEPRQKKKAR